MGAKIGYKLKIGNVKFYRREEDYNYIKHYTTKILEIEDKKIKCLDGFSLTDTYYIDYMIWKHGMDSDISIIFRCPRYGNSIFLLKYKNDVIMPKMSADIVFGPNDNDVIKYYLKPIIKTLNVSYQNLLKDLRVMDQYGNIFDISDYKPNYFPYVRELEGSKPDMTIEIYDGKKHIIDVYEPYYFYVINPHTIWHTKEMVFMGYLKDLSDLGVIPDLSIKHVHTDLWRTRTESDIKNDNTSWIKLSDYEWCGAYSESAEKLHDIYEDCKLMTDFNFFEYVIAIIHYSSNIFVTYIDIYVKPKTLSDKMMRNVKMLKERISEARYTQIEEILKNIFPSIFS